MSEVELRVVGRIPDQVIPVPTFDAIFPEEGEEGDVREIWTFRPATFKYN